MWLRNSWTQLGHHLVLGGPRTAEAHRPLVGPGGDVRRGAHQVELGARLEQAHVVQHVVQGHELRRRMAAIARLGAQAVHPADHALVELRVDAHGVVHARLVLEQAGEDLVQVGDREGIVGAVVAPRPGRSGAPAVPGLAQRVALAHEQDVLGLGPARHQHGHRLGFCEAGQVVEVAVLAVGVLDVVVAQAHRGGRQHGDGVTPHQLHQRPAAVRELVSCHGSFPKGCFSAGGRRPGRPGRGHRPAPRTTAARRRARTRPAPRRRSRWPRRPGPRPPRRA